MPPDSPELRPYQRDAVDAVLAARRRGVRRMVVCLPTGAGKTVIFAHLAGMARRQVLVLAHREELLAQARDKLARALGDGAVVAIEQGALRAPPEARVLVCSLRSLREARLAALLRGRDVGLVIYDECHHAPADDNRRVLTQLGAMAPAWTGTLVGFTATTGRGDGRGLEAVFEQIVYARTLPEMIADGYLCPLRGLRVSTAADLSRVSRGSGADLPEDELAEAVDIEERNALVARSIQELARDRRTIAFCVTVRHARNLAHALNRVGVPAAIVHGEMARDARARVLADFRSEKLRVVANVAVLTEGFDDPGVSCVAMARPTRSSGLYAQCVGRGTRLFAGKSDCLVLDFVDLSGLDLCTLPSLFGLPRQVDLAGERADEAKREWDALMEECPGIELAEAEAVTLREVQERAKRFDPLGLRLDEEVRAISGNAWQSLGRYGLVLHYERRAGRLTEVLVREAAARGKRKWEVRVDGREVARFGTIEEAVQAVDYEVARAGRAAQGSAREEAAWRRARAAGTPGRTAEQAARLAVWEREVAASVRVARK